MAETHSKRFPRLRLLVRHSIRVVLAIVFIAALILLIGLFPINNDFQSTPDGIEILVTSNELHADLILPIDAGSIDWTEKLSQSDFSGDISGATHVAIGWGDRRFFIETPSWSELSLSKSARALFWPTESCLHVQFLSAEDLPKETRSIRIRADQYERLVAFIDSTFARTPNGVPIRIPNAAYGSNDAFFEATGSFHCLNTCNSWVGRALKQAGVRVGLYTPMPKSIYLHLPDDQAKGDHERERGMKS